MPRISLIAALGKDSHSIGHNNQLLWRIPDDLARFKRLTMGHPVVMGRTTFESIGKPLPGRTNIAITRNRSYTAPGATVVHTIDDALHEGQKLNTDEVFILGGGDIYRQTIDRADRLYLTYVDDDTPGDTHFPRFDQGHFRVLEEEYGTHDDLTTHFVILERIATQ